MSILKLQIQANKIARENPEIDINTFLLRNPLKLDNNLLKAVAEQINFVQKSKSKLPTWFDNQFTIGPSKLSIEQTSSEITASFKASKFKGENFLDLSGGFGVDSYFFSKRFRNCTYVEIQKELSEIVKYNFEQMEVQNVTIVNQNAESFLKTQKNTFDIIYLDPARRDSENNKLVDITACEPNLIEIQPKLLEIGTKILVKYSPMLDIKKTIYQLKNIENIYIVAIKNEVKELLFEIGQTFTKSPKIICQNIINESKIENFEFDFETEQMQNGELSIVQNYLYEPNAAILKGGGFKSIASHFGVLKIGVNSHLYTSTELIEDFYGRSFLIEKIGSFDKKEILQNIKNKTANISVRNFPIKAEEIKKKLGIKDGGDNYLFFTQDIHDKKIVIYCKKL
jgi:16S rRNA G966 N2-methylase RsmD